MICVSVCSRAGMSIEESYETKAWTKADDEKHEPVI